MASGLPLDVMDIINASCDSQKITACLQFENIIANPVCLWCGVLQAITQPRKIDSIDSIGWIEKERHKYQYKSLCLFCFHNISQLRFGDVRRNALFKLV